MRHWIIVVTLLAGALAAAACDDERPTPTPTAPTTTTPPPTTPPSDPEPTSLAIDGPDSLMVGATAQYHATITYSDGAEKPGEGVEWVSGNTTVATVDAAGIVTGRQAGAFDLRAMSMGVSGSKTGILVEAPEATSLRVEGPDSLQVGQTVTYEAVVTLSDGSTATATDVEWASSNTTVATVDAAGDVTGRQAGAFDLSATAMGVSGRQAGIRVDARPQTQWRGLTIASENRCSPYDSDDYSYPQSVEDDIVRQLGGIFSPYTCESFDSDTQTDIEHIVARSEAHDSGLCRADAGTRRQFARDLLNLTLASPSLNRSQKSDKDAAEWMPEQNRCWFAQTIVDVRLMYGLTIDQREADAIDRMLAGCTSTAISCSNITRPPAADHPPVQAYQNCTAMREAGWNRGVNRNGGTYRDSWDDAERRTYSLNTSSDRDNDGHACE